MRTLNRLYAWLFDYFWLPCPVCGKFFGGHEISKNSTAALVKDDGRAYVVCPDHQCNYEAGVLNASNGHQCFVRSNDRAKTTKNENGHIEIKEAK